MRTAWVLAAVCAVCAMTARADAAPLAKASLDVDGDGKPDEVELEATGALRVGATTRLTVKLPARTAKARIEAAKTSTGTWMVIAAIGGATDEAFVINARIWQVASTLPLGGVGLDREYSLELAATPDGILRYQSRGDVRRCDGKPAYLFVERLDGVRGPVTPPIDVPAGAPMLTAKIDASAAAPGGAPAPPLIYHARAASHQAGATDAGGLAIPSELDDGNHATVWREDLPGSSGEGQFFTFTPRVEGARARSLRIVPGNPASGQTLRTFNRPRVLAIVTAREAWRVELQDPATQPLGAAYTIELPEAVAGCVTVILESVHGRPQGTTAIAELQVFAEGERAGGGEALLAKIVAEGKGGDVAASAALAKRGAAAAIALDAELQKTTDAGARRRLVGALAKLRDPAATPALVRAATSGWVRDKDLLDVILTLGQTRQAGALAELAAKGGLPIEIRVAAASQLTPTGDGYASLVELAGTGPRQVRREVIERLALAPSTMLIQTATTQTRPSGAGDVWRALTRRARSHAAERGAIIGAMMAALPTATDYERRYRLIDGIAAHGDAEALRALDKLLAALPVGASSAALRQVAINAIASTPRVEAAPLVISLAQNADPGVRLAALAALASAETDASDAWHAGGSPDGIDRVIINGLTSDAWPEVRRRAAMALGARCQRPGPASALAEAVIKDPVIDVRGDALTALVQCKAATIRELLPRTWTDAKAPCELRERAVSLAVMLEDPQVAQLLVARFAAWRAEAISSACALKLAIQAAVAIGKLRAPGAAKVLMDALDDPAFPEIVGAAALGLGSLGVACSGAAKTKLLALARSDSQASTAARHAANQCGR